jgi:asparagine synthase (glutamine-hydrolysing)
VTLKTGDEMCGIVALWNKHHAINPDELLSATRLLQHRGPDCQKIWTAHHQRAGLGHARLSIIDLVGGDQPLHSQDGKLHVVVNGEFYDYETIRASLIQKGYVFSTESDSEIILPLYREYGVECLAHLNGEFAFVLYDEEKHVMFAARDRFGIKPLYYAIYEGNLYLASEVKAILKLGVPARWNEEAIWMSTFGVPDQSLSCFQGIRYVKPGHYLLANMDKSSCVEKLYWDLSFPAETSVPDARSDEEYIEQFQQLFAQAVRRRLRADVPVGCYLSGGIDSAAVTAMAAQLSQQPVSAFNVAFEEVDALNESKFAKELSDSKGIFLHSIPITTQDIADHYAHALWHTEWPIPNGSPVAKYLLSKYVNELGYRVVMTGEGSDELLMGYPNLWVDSIRYSSSSADQQAYEQFELARKNAQGVGKLDSILTQQIVQKIGYVPFVMQVSYLAADFQLFSEEFTARHPHQRPELLFFNRLLVPNNISKPNMSAYIHIKSLLPIGTLNFLGDRTEMANSIEGRPPFFDNDLVEFMQKLPLRLKVRGSLRKYILNHAMKDHLPSSIRERVKHEFLAPTGSHEKSPIYKLMQEVFNSESLRRIPFLNHQRVIDRFNQLMKPDHRPRYVQEVDISHLHVALSLCLLGEKFNISA